MDAAGGTQSRRQAEFLGIPDVTGQCRMAGKRTPHPPLRPVRRNGSNAQYRPHSPNARLARHLARRGRPRGRKTFAGASMPVLRRPDDHRRDVRRPTPWALSAAKPDQDRHLMIAIAVFAATQCRSRSPPAASLSRNATSSQGIQSCSRRHARARRWHARPRKRSSSSFPPRTIRDAGLRSLTSASSETPKSP